MRTKQKKPKGNMARLRAVQKMLAANPEGAKLLALARQWRIPISFSTAPDKMDALGLFDIEAKTVTLNPNQNDKALSGVLAHELRHMWQAGVANVKEKNLSAVDRLVRRRLIEGDAFAFEKRFQLSAHTGKIEKLAEVAKKLPSSPGRARVMKSVTRIRARFGMKAGFLDAQKKRMGGYDKITLQVLRLQLQITRLYANEKKLLTAHPAKSEAHRVAVSKCNKALKSIFNEASAPQPLKDSLLNITREGLSPGSPNYLGVTTTKQLAALVRRQIPVRTLEKARSIEKKIKKTAARALGRP